MLAKNAKEPVVGPGGDTATAHPSIMDASVTLCSIIAVKYGGAKISAVNDLKMHTVNSFILLKYESAFHDRYIQCELWEFRYLTECKEKILRI